MMKRGVIGLLCLLMALGAAQPVWAEDETEVAYFYENPCASCNEEAEFYESFGEIVGDLREGQSYSLRAHNTIREGRETFLDYCDRWQVPASERSMPILFFEKGPYLQGEAAIKDGMRDAFAEAMGLDLAETSRGVGADNDKADILGENLMEGDAYILYYYRDSCKDCVAIAGFMKRIQDANPQLTIQRVDTTAAGNKEFLYELYDRYDVPPADRQVPALFYQNGYLSGTDDIRANLEAVIRDGRTAYAGFLTDSARPVYDGGLSASAGRALANAFSKGQLSFLCFAAALCILFRKRSWIPVLAAVLGRIAGQAAGALGLYRNLELSKFEVMIQYSSWILAVSSAGILLAAGIRFGRRQLEARASIWTVTALVLLAGAGIGAGEFFRMLYGMPVELFYQIRTANLSGPASIHYIVYLLCGSIPAALAFILIPIEKSLRGIAARRGDAWAASLDLALTAAAALAMLLFIL